MITVASFKMEDDVFDETSRRVLVVNDFTQIKNCDRYHLCVFEESGKTVKQTHIGEINDFKRKHR